MNLKCPRCGVEPPPGTVGMVTDIPGKTEPGNGDYSICTVCASVGVVRDDHIERLTVDELVDLHPMLQIALAQGVREVKRKLEKVERGLNPGFNGPVAEA